MLQILLAHINPDIVIRVLALNIYPNQRTGLNLLIPISNLSEINDPIKEFSYELMLRYIFGAITERHFIGYTENSYLDYLERQIVHILLVGNCSRKKILAQLSIYREINSSEDKSSFQFLDSILPKVANINSSNQLDNTFSLKDIFYDHINRFYYQLNLTQVSSVYENLKRRSQHLPIKYRPLPLPSLKPEFIGIIDFLVSDAFINFLLNLINQIWSNTNTIYKESDLFELSLMCLNLIISTLFIPHIKSQYDNKLNSILMPQEIFNNKSILEFLTDIEKQIAEPITLAVIQAIILQLTSGRSDQRHISTNPEIDHKKKAVERKEAILEQIKEFSENFYKHNPDWLLYNENPPQTDQDVEKNTVLTNVLDKKIYCIVCKMSQNVEIAHSHSITEFPTNFVYCARLRWTRRLSGYTSFFANTPHIETDIPTALIQLSIEDIYSTDSSMPKLYLSGCSHLLHFSCATANENILSTVNGAVRTNHSYQCSICTTNNNVFLPNINPFYFMQPKNINISSFMEWASSTIFCAQKQSQSDTTSTIDEIQPITPMPSFGFNTDIYHMDEHSSLHFDRYNMAFFKYVKTADNSESFIGKYEPIIAITQNCLVCTISVLEIVSRNEENSSIFHHSISETTNFLTCAQFSRYCYYSSGLAPSLANREHYESHLFALIKAYASSCFIITTFLKILKNEISVNEFPEINNVDYFSLLISTLFGFSCMNRLLCLGNKTGEIRHDVEINSLRFIYILLVLNIFINFNPCESSENKTNASYDDVENVFSSFSLICPMDSNFDQNTKKSLYLSWLYGVLPFCRQSAILIYQLFNLKSPSTLSDKFSSPPTTYIHDLLDYLYLPHNFTSIFKKDELILFRTYFSNAKGYIQAKKIPPSFYLNSFNTKRISLIELPASYLELLIQARQIKCTICKMKCKSLFKCLFCGEWIVYKYLCTCLPKSILKKICFAHSLSCDCYEGLYLEVHNTLIHWTRGGEHHVFRFSIYEDAYIGLARGYRAIQNLSKERYQRLNYLFQRDLISSMTESRSF